MNDSCFESVFPRLTGTASPRARLVHRQDPSLIVTGCFRKRYVGSGSCRPTAPVAEFAEEEAKGRTGGAASRTLLSPARRHHGPDGGSGVLRLLLL